MLFKSLWRRLLGVGSRVVIEDAVFEPREDGEPVLVVSVRLRRRRPSAGSAAAVGGSHPVTTVVLAVDAGAAWTRARPGPTSRPRRLG